MQVHTKTDAKTSKEAGYNSGMLGLESSSSIGDSKSFVEGTVPAYGTKWINRLRVPILLVAS